MEKLSNQSTEKPEGERVAAQLVSVLDCNSGIMVKGRKKDRVVILSLGRQDASIDKLALVLPEANRLLYQIAFVLGREKGTIGPANEEAFLKRWGQRHSPGRSELNVHGLEEKYFEKLRYEIQDAGEYFTEQFDAISRLIRRKKGNITNPEALMKRIRTLVLTAFDMGRPDK